MSAAALSTTAPAHPALRWGAGALAVAFGIATLAEGGSVLFGGAQARAAAGHVVPFVLGFNFAAGFAYVLAGFAAALGRRQALWIARALALSTLAVFSALGVHALLGGAFETRTPVAMTVRSMFWIALSLVLPRLLKGVPHA